MKLAYNSVYDPQISLGTKNLSLKYPDVETKVHISHFNKNQNDLLLTTDENIHKCD